MTTKNPTTPFPQSEQQVELLTAKAVAQLCGCSSRHIRRLTDAGKMPAPIRLGGAVRWRHTEILNWIADGCPRVRIVRGGAA